MSQIRRNDLVGDIASSERSLRPDGVIDLGGARRVVLGDVLGRGAYSAVMRGALESESGVRRGVAVKMFSVVGGDELDRVWHALSRSARRLASFDHPNVVRVYECGVCERQPFLVTELVSGVSLAALQETYLHKRRRLPLDLVLFVAAEVADALDGALSARDLDGRRLDIVHQGLSSREVLLSWRGEVKVSDFAISAARGSTSSVRSLQGIAKRVATMAPEVAQGAAPDARADVFSFGVMLRELLVGPRFPHPLSDADAIALARDGFVQPMTFQPRLPAGLAALIESALAIDPDARYASMSMLAVELKRMALAMGVGDGRYFLRAALERECRGHPEETAAERRYPVARTAEATAYEEAPPRRRK